MHTIINPQLNVVGDIANVLHPIAKVIPQTAWLADSIKDVEKSARSNANRSAKPKKEKASTGTLVKSAPPPTVKKKPLPPTPQKKK